MNQPSTVSPESLLAFAALLEKAGREVLWEVRGNSMGDALPEGCTIRIRAAPPESYRAGQVVAFLGGTVLTAHRVAYRGKGRLARYLITQGDARTPCDPPIEVAAVLGVVTEFCWQGQWQPTPASASRSAAGQRKADLHVALVRGLLSCHIGLARRIAGTLLRLHRRFR